MINKEEPPIPATLHLTPVILLHARIGKLFFSLLVYGKHALYTLPVLFLCPSFFRGGKETFFFVLKYAMCGFLYLQCWEVTLSFNENVMVIIILGSVNVMNTLRNILVLVLLINLFFSDSFRWFIIHGIELWRNYGTKHFPKRKVNWGIWTFTCSTAWQQLPFIDDSTRFVEISCKCFITFCKKMYQCWK